MLCTLCWHSPPLSVSQIARRPNGKQKRYDIGGAIMVAKNDVFSYSGTFKNPFDSSKINQNHRVVKGICRSERPFVFGGLDKTLSPFSGENKKIMV